MISPESSKQLDRYRQMTGEQRLAIALQMHEFACDIAREGLRRQFPRESSDQHEQRLKDRIRASQE
jgi:hypothetical protein